jgi:hypothetical protein
MKNTKLITLLSVIALSLLLSGCFLRKESCKWENLFTNIRPSPRDWDLGIIRNTWSQKEKSNKTGWRNW